MNYSDIIYLVSLELGLPLLVVKRAYIGFWLYIKEHIKSLPLKEVITEELFSALRVNFNIPSLGKLCVTLDRLIGCKKKFELLNKLKGEGNVKSKED